MYGETVTFGNTIMKKRCRKVILDCKPCFSPTWWLIRIQGFAQIIICSVFGSSSCGHNHVFDRRPFISSVMTSQLKCCQTPPKEGKSFSLLLTTRRLNLLNVSANESGDILKLFLRCDSRHSAVMFLAQLPRSHLENSVSPSLTSCGQAFPNQRA